MNGISAGRSAAVVTLVLLFCAASALPALADEHGRKAKPAVENPFLGQPLPGTTPDKFAPGIVSTNTYTEYGAAFSPDGTEFYFTRGGAPDFTLHKILVSRYVNGEWTAPAIAEFFFADDACLQPWMTFDGNTIFFSSRHAVDGVAEERIWAVSRQGDGWAEPVPVNSVVNDPAAYHLNMSRSGEVFFSSDNSVDGFGIFTATYKSGVFSARSRPGAPINSDFFDNHAFIAPDGSFVLFDSNRPGGAGDADFYVSFKRGGTVWTSVQKLSEAFGMPGQLQIPTMTHDGKYLFFLAGGDIYWVDTKAVRTFAPTDLSVSKLKVKPKKNVLRGKTATVKALIKNSADFDSSDTAVDIYLSTNGKISKKSVLLGRIELGSIKASGKKKLNEKITVPNNVKPNSYFFVIKLADDTINVDPNDSNNEAKTKKKVPVQ